MAELFYRALALRLSSALPTLCGQLARRSTAKLCHNQLHMVWYGMVEVCEGAPVAVSGWVLTDRHDVW